MAEENEDGQEKTEEPSQRKLDKAAEDGKVLTSKEMFVFTSVGMGLAMLLVSTSSSRRSSTYGEGCSSLTLLPTSEALVLVS